jgi:hypothetical protein
MSVGGILGESWRLYTKFFSRFFVIALIVYLIVNLVNALVATQFGHDRRPLLRRRADPHVLHAPGARRGRERARSCVRAADTASSRLKSAKSAIAGLLLCSEA